MNIIETQRTYIRKYTLEDAGFVFKLVNSPKWIQYIGDKKVYSHEDALDFIRNKFFKSYLDHGFGYYVIERKEDGKPVGTCGLVDRDGLDHIDIGYGLLPEYEGKGYAFEGTKALYDYTIDKLGIEKIQAITLPENKGSVKLLEKLGMNFQNMIHIPGDTEQLMLFSN